MEKYDWKKENPFIRYIDSITNEELEEICLFACGQQTELRLINVMKGSNNNNIPYCKVEYRYFDEFLLDYSFETLFIDHWLNISQKIHLINNQKNIFQRFKEMKFNENANKL